MQSVNCKSQETIRQRILLGDLSSVVSAFLLATLITVGFAVTSPRFHHWFVFPVLLCGALAGIDAVDWCRGRVPLFDPVGLLGIMATFSLLIAPLLHVALDYWMWEVSPPPDWRDWLGRMAILNVLGLLAYRTAKHVFSRPALLHLRSSTWRAHTQTFWTVVITGLVVASLLQVLVYIKLGGISGYIENFHNNTGAFDGMGLIFMFSEPFPILLAFAFVAYTNQWPQKSLWLRTSAFLLLFFALQMLFGGLRGSRLNTAVGLFWAVGVIHFLVRPVSKRAVLAGFVFLLAFMYAYGFYKDGGELTSVFADARERRRFSDRSFTGVLLGDLSRSDVQAYVLYKLMSDPHDFKYAHGRTYLASLALPIPSVLLPKKPEGKFLEGSDFIWGPGTYVPRVLWSSRIYGIAGEAMINFSPLSVPLAYAVLGICAARMQSYISTLQPGDLRFLIVPFGVYLCIWALNGDSDNLVFTSVKDGLIPTIVVLVSATRFNVIRTSPIMPPMALNAVASQTHIV